MIPAALIFDVDGTLAETEEVHRLAFNDSFARAGLDWSWDPPLYRRLLDVTGGKERIRHFASLGQVSLGQVSLGQVALDDAAVTDLHAFKTRRFAERVAGGDLTLRPGIARLIGAARARNIPLGIATTTSLPNIETLLAVTLGPDAMDWFAAIGAGDMVAAKKPSPDVYRLVLERLGVDAAGCIAFEDSRNGLDAATAAGVPTVVTVSRFTDDHDFTGALAVLDHLGEPDLPCTSLAGPRPSEGYVTIDDLERWLTER